MTDRYTELGETLEEVVCDGDGVACDGGLEGLFRLNGLQFMSETGDLDLEVGDRLEGHSSRV